jgi:general secretion pathway protein I
MSNARGQAAACQGFTLLEVMIALAIFATLAAAVLSASQFVLKQSAGLQAQFAQLIVRQPGQQRLNRHLDRRDWVLQQRVAPAHDGRLLRVEIQVSRGDSATVVRRTTGWIGRRHE